MGHRKYQRIFKLMETPPLLPRVEQTIFDGQPAWIKRPEETRSSRFVILHKILQHIMPKVLHPTGALGGMGAIRQEAKRLEIFGAASLPVPKVLALTEGSVVLSDTGKQLRGVLLGMTDAQLKFLILERAIRGLVAVHAAGLSHGRPFLKDMTVDADDTLHFLDLEEDPTARMSLEDAQARDVWLLLSSCTEFCEEPFKDLNHLLNIYISEYRSSISVNLSALGKALRPYRRIISMLRVKDVSKDVTGAYWSVRVLEDL
tara:strand:- start:4092 stop:4868 length:777 start_codon:yes stop_codon:yes gene_type:complete